MGRRIPKWIDEQPHTLEGEIYFLARSVAALRGRSRWFLDHSPCRKNFNRQPLLSGWCGTTNDVSLYAHGLARVVKFAKNGRTCIEAVAWDSPDGQAALENAGYPGLRGDDG